MLRNDFHAEVQINLQTRACLEGQGDLLPGVGFTWTLKYVEKMPSGRGEGEAAVAQWQHLILVPSLPHRHKCEWICPRQASDSSTFQMISPVLLISLRAPQAHSDKRSIAETRSKS